MANTTIHPVKVLTVEEAADALRISRSKLYRLIAEGKVPHRKVDGWGVRLTSDDVDEILADAFRPAVA